MKNYDIIIIGGGIAGIYTMYNLKKEHPHLKVLLLQKQDRFGGRIYTYHKKFDNKNYIMDLGAGRIGFHHNYMNKLVKELKLDKYIVPIKNTENYIEYNKDKNISENKSNLKKKYSKILYNLLNSSKIKNISDTILKKNYFSDILKKFFNNKEYKTIENTFEYNNKLNNLNSYNAIKYFRDDYNHLSKFYILSVGYDSIIYKMIESIEKNKNYKLQKNSYVQNIVYDTNKNQYSITYNNKKVNCKYVVCAIPRNDLIKFNILKKYNYLLNTINEISKVRIFQIYKKDEINNKMWFENIEKTSTNNELQFVIPINSNNGLIMSSYNENISTKKNYWNELFKRGGNLFHKTLQKKLSNLFNIYVPISEYTKICYWPKGIACWKKNVDSSIVSEKILNIMHNFYICGENYSEYQAWCEGALETSEKVLCKLYCDLQKTNKNKTKKNKKQ